MYPATSFPVTMDSAPGPSTLQYWDPATMYSWSTDPLSTTPYSPSCSWDGNSSPNIPYTHYPYSITPTDYSMDVPTIDPAIYPSTTGYMNFNPIQDPAFYNYSPGSTPSRSSSMLPSPSTTPPTPIAPSKATSTKIPKIKPTARGNRKCSRCSTTNSCRWKNIKSESSMLCNTCFIYQRRTGKDRSTKTIIAHQAMQMHFNK